MAEIKNGCHGSQNPSGGRDTVCIDCKKIYDSCKDKDCFEDVRVFLTDYGREVIDKTGSIREKAADLIWTGVSVDPVPFNRGFYQIFLRFYVRILFEACVCPGHSQEIEGIAVCEKKVILYGSEGEVSIFKSNPFDNGFCTPIPDSAVNARTNLPTAVCEVAAPLVLDVKIKERGCGDHHPCCSCDEIPERVACRVNGNLLPFDEGKGLYVTLGFFSVVRLERPAQFMISAVPYCVPNKECVIGNDTAESPCSLFAKMEFPTEEFCPPSYRQLNGGSGRSCGCC